MVIAQQLSGMQLDWYKEYWINTTKTIDYGIGEVSSKDGKTAIVLKRVGEMPMPVDVQVTFKDGSKEMHNIPLNLMYGSKKSENTDEKYFVHDEWRWTHPEYKLTLDKDLNAIKKIEIDPSKRMADINRSDNVVVK